MRKNVKIFFICAISFLIPSHLALSMGVYKNTSLIPAGEFLMGTDEGTEIELPVHKVYLKAFRISKFEVSNKEFKNEFKVSITFDDGYKDNFDNALPILIKYNIISYIYIQKVVFKNFSNKVTASRVPRF